MGRALGRKLCVTINVKVVSSKQRQVIIEWQGEVAPDVALKCWKWTTVVMIRLICLYGCP